jgi:hypothetical protein
MMLGMDPQTLLTGGSLLTLLALPLLFWLTMAKHHEAIGETEE